MPLMKCKKNGKSGWKYGPDGACYVGPGSKRKAIKQGLAIDGPEGFKANAQALPEEIEDAVAELLTQGAEPILELGSPVLDGVQAYISQKERDKVSEEDFGWPEERKYPIRNQQDLDAAVKLIGRAPKAKQAGIKSRIKKIAKRKGLTLPDSWK